MASIYDEINRIKREGIDSPQSPNPNQQMKVPNIKMVADFAPTLVYGQKGVNANQLTNSMIGDQVDPSFGKSQYDQGINWQDLTSGDRSLSDFRAERQPWYDQWANNLVNFGVIGATTAIDGLIGTGAGILNMVFNPYDEAETNLNWLERQGSKFTQNAVTTGLNDFRESVKEAMPTYLSDEYLANRENGEWYKNILSSEFIGETLFENSGFMAGMAASGMVAGGALNNIMKVGKEVNILRNGVDKAIKAGKINGSVDDVVAKILKNKQSLDGIDLTGELASAAKNIRRSGVISSSLSTAMAVSGEARLEGAMNAKDYKEGRLAEINSIPFQQELAVNTVKQLFEESPEMFVGDPNSSSDILSTIKPEYLSVFQARFDENKGIIEKEANDAGDRVAAVDFALNFPILYASGAIQFGKAFARGYNTQKGFLNNLKGAVYGTGDDLAVAGADRIIQEGGEYVIKNSVVDKIRRAGKIALNPFAEANEEMLQEASSDISKKLAGAELNERVATSLNRGKNTFSGFKVDAEAEQHQLNAINAIWNGIKDTYSDPASYEMGFAGLFSGGMGMVNFTGSKMADGSRPFIQGGVYGAIRDARNETSELQAVTDALNRRVQSPEFRNYYQGLVRHNALENNKSEALDNDNKFAFMNNDHAQLISDIIMFERAGKGQDLIDTIEGNINRFSTTNQDDITALATEMREASINQETGKSLYEGKTDAEIVADALATNQEYKESVDTYREIATNLKATIGSKFLNEDAFHEMTYLFSQTKNFDKRYQELHSGIVEKLKDLKNKGLLQEKFPINLHNSEKELTFDELIQELSPGQLYDYFFDTITQESTNPLSDVLATNKHLFDVINDQANGIENSTEETAKAVQRVKEVSAALERSVEREAILQDFLDMMKIEDSRKRLVNLYNTYLTNPALLNEKLVEDMEDEAGKQEEIVNKSVYDKLREASSRQEIKDIIQQERDKKNPNIDRIIAEMSISDNNNKYSPNIAEYRKVENLENEVSESNAISKLDSNLINGAADLYYAIVDRVGSYDNILDADVLPEDLEVLSEYSPEDSKKIQEALKESFREIKERNSKYSKVASKKEIVSNNQTPAEKKVTPTEDDPIIGNQDKGSIAGANKEIEKSLLDGEQATVESRKKFVNNGTFQIDIDAHRDLGEFRQQGAPYNKAVDFLNQHGAFNYINGGNIRPGDTIKFLASTEYWDALRHDSTTEQINWINSNKPLLLVKEDPNGSYLVDGKKYQVVGTYVTKNSPKLVESLTNGMPTTSEVTSVAQEEFDPYTSFRPQSESLYEDIDALYGMRSYVGLAKFRVGDYVMIEQKDPAGKTFYRVVNHSNTYKTKAFTSLESARRALSERSEGRPIERLDEPRAPETSANTSTITPVNRVSNVSTRVVDVTAGRLAYTGTNEKALNTMPNKTPWGEEIEHLFGIATLGGNIETNLSSSEITHFNVSNKAGDSPNSGRLYYMVKGANGTYIPNAIRVKNIAEVDTSIDTPLFNELRGYVNDLATAAISTSEEQVAEAVQGLRNILYIGSKAGTSINLRTTNHPQGKGYVLEVSGKNNKKLTIPISSPQVRDMSEQGFQDGGVEIVQVPRELSLITSDILYALRDVKAPFQVSKDNINSRWNVKRSLNYNDVIIESGILTTNLVNNYPIASYFFMNPINENLQEERLDQQGVKTAPTKTPDKESVVSQKPIVTINSGGKDYTINDKGDVLDTAGKVVKGNTELIVKFLQYYDNLSEEARKEITYDYSEISEYNAVLHNSGSYILTSPGAIIYNRTTLFAPSSSLADAIKKAKAKRETAKVEVVDEVDEIVADTAVPLFQTPPAQTSPQVEDVNDEVVASVSLFGNSNTAPKTETPTAPNGRKTPPPPPPPLRKRASRSDVLNNTDTNTSAPTLSREDIEKRIKDNRDFQERNCNGIAPKQ